MMYPDDPTPLQTDASLTHRPTTAGGWWSRPRVRGLAVALPGLAVLAAALWLAPDGRGYDTHTQLGLPACGFLQSTGLPCPTCGMTTSFAHMARGEVRGALAANVAGAGLFALTALAALAGAVQTLTAWPLLRWPRGGWWLWALLGGVLAGWALNLALGLASGRWPTR